jgi:hypothetical protein
LAACQQKQLSITLEIQCSSSSVEQRNWWLTRAFVNDQLESCGSSKMKVESVWSKTLQSLSQSNSLSPPDLLLFFWYQ